MKIHHFGYLVNNIDDAVADFQKLGYVVSSSLIFDEKRKIFIQFLEFNPTNTIKNEIVSGGTRIELITPAQGCELFSKRLRSLGSIPYHICYECQDFKEKILELQAEGFLLIREPQVAPAIENRQVVFMYSNSIGLIELLEVK